MHTFSSSDSPSLTSNSSTIIHMYYIISITDVKNHIKSQKLSFVVTVFACLPPHEDVHQQIGKLVPPIRVVYFPPPFPCQGVDKLFFKSLLIMITSHYHNVFKIFKLKKKCFAYIYCIRHDIRIYIFYTNIYIYIYIYINLEHTKSYIALN